MRVDCELSGMAIQQYRRFGFGTDCQHIVGRLNDRKVYGPATNVRSLSRMRRMRNIVFGFDVECELVSLSGLTGLSWSVRALVEFGMSCTVSRRHSSLTTTREGDILIEECTKLLNVSRLL